MTKFHRRGRGYALMTVLLLAGFFITIAGAIGSEVLSGLAATRSRVSTSTARFAAYAGLQHAVQLLRHDRSYSEDLLGVLMPDSNTVSYSVDITNNSEGLAPITAPDDYVVPPGMIYCAAIGIDDGQEGVALHALSGLVSSRRPELKYAAFSDQSTDLTGSAQSLSFDPDACEFEKDTASARVIPSVSGSSGDIGTNRYISLDSSAAVSGNVYRPGSEASSTQQFTASLRGTSAIMDLERPVDIPKYSSPVEVKVPPTALSNSSTLTAAADETKVLAKLQLAPSATLEVGSGRYFFPDGIDLQGELKAKSDVTPENPIVFFLGDDAHFADSARINLGGRSASFQLYFVDNKRDGNPKFQMEGASQFFGTVVGNRVEGLLSGQAELYGGFLGRSMKAQDSARLVFDESLRLTPLQESANWGLNGVTEPRPEQVLKEGTKLKQVVVQVKNRTINYKKALGDLQSPLSPTY